jgi:hypothetical protein
MSLDRATVWKQLGAPNDQQGSVNDPRTQEDYGAVWNEKWIYRSKDGESIARIVLWNRYDFVGAFRLNEDGTAQPEMLDGESETPTDA